jgi:hypothetical protein
MHVQHHRYEVCRSFESKTHFKSFINHYTLERLYILSYLLLKFLTEELMKPKERSKLPGNKNIDNIIF